MIKDIYNYERELTSKGYINIAGTDEAGRGPMAGPLVVASCILPSTYTLDGLDDSKKISPKMRDKLFDIIKRDAIEYHIEVISVEDVDRLNVYAASKLGMERCIKAYQTRVDYVLSDAMPLDIDIPYLSIIKGDAKSASIAASSILAKVTRDRIMVELDKKYPEYNFKKHKGYVTKEHLEAIKKYGVCEVHRKSFSPVAEIINKKEK